MKTDRLGGYDRSMAAEKFMRGNKAETVALALGRLLKQNTREGTLFGAHPGPVQVGEGAGIVGPVLDVVPEAETGREVER